MGQQKLKVGVEWIVDVERDSGSEREGEEEGERDTAMRTEKGGGLGEAGLKPRAG